MDHQSVTPPAVFTDMSVVHDLGVKQLKIVDSEQIISGKADIIGELT